MRIVLVSTGHIARRFAAELSREHDVVVVHRGEAGRAELEKLDVEVIDGSGNDIQTLQRAGAGGADWVVACTRADEVNILACLAARQLGKAKTVCFVTKEEYVRTFGGEDGNGGPVEAASPQFGIDTLVWPAQMLADRIEQVLAVPGATDVGLFARGQIGLLEYRLPAELPLLGRPLMEIRSLPPAVLIVGVRRKDDWFVPRGQSVLQEGDRVSFVGRSESMHRLAAWFAEQLGETKGRDVVIIGAGTVGLRLARSLERNPQNRIKLIEMDGPRCREAAETLQRALVLHGDGCDVELLEAERAHEANALVAVTDSDEKNLLASLLGRQLGVPRVVTRVTSAANRRVFERVGIDVPLSARGAAMDAVLHLIRHKEVDLLATIGEGQGELLEVTLPEEFTPTALKEIVLPEDSIVAAVVSRGQALVPGGATLIGPGDRCLVVCKTPRVADVRAALQV